MNMHWESDMEPENTKPEAHKYTDPDLQDDITQSPDDDYAEELGL
jgi:hypothetical protein